MKLAKVQLVDGVEFDGRRHTTVTIRGPLVGDYMDAEKECEGKGELFRTVTMLLKTVVEFGGIPRAAVDFDLFMKLTDLDFERISYAFEDLKKKGHWLNMV